MLDDEDEFETDANFCAQCDNSLDECDCCWDCSATADTCQCQEDYLPDDVTAQKILQDWATSRGFSTTLTEKKLYFHYDKFNGFATLDFEKSPALRLEVSSDSNYTPRAAFWAGVPDWGNLHPKQIHDAYDLTLADEKVFAKIERILERTIDSYIEG